MLQAIIFIFLSRNFVPLDALSIIIMFYSFIPQNMEYVHELRFSSSFLLTASIFLLHSIRRKCLNNFLLQQFLMNKVSYAGKIYHRNFSYQFFADFFGFR